MESATDAFKNKLSNPYRRDKGTDYPERGIRIAKSFSAARVLLESIYSLHKFLYLPIVSTLSLGLENWAYLP
jgi:hypothetical protein